MQGFKGAAYKKFKTEQEASTWMRQVQGGAPPALAAAKALSSPSSKSQPVASSSKAPHERCPRDPNVRQVFSDGACAHNGKRNATAGSGVFWGDSALWVGLLFNSFQNPRAKSEAGTSPRSYQVLLKRISVLSST